MHNVFLTLLWRAWFRNILEWIFRDTHYRKKGYMVVQACLLEHLKSIAAFVGF